MLTVTVNGKEFTASTGGAKTMGELVELVKANIDPELIITSLTINGQQLGEADWRAPLSVQGNSTLEIVTGGKGDYVSERLRQASAVVDHIINEFAHSRAFFANGLVTDGNSALSVAVEDLKAFMVWYRSLLDLLPEGKNSSGQNFQLLVDDLSNICQQVVQQQLYQSWWAVAETLETRLEPKLEELKQAVQTSEAR